MKKLLSLALVVMLFLSLCGQASAASFAGKNASGSSGNASYAGMGELIQFSTGKFYGGQMLPVYSGPGYEYYRAANGYAKMSTDDTAYVAGREGSWILVLYSIKDGYRVGYVDRSQLKYTYHAREIDFAYTSAAITKDCALTQDPISARPSTLANISAGEYVTYLGDFYDKKSYAYIELEVDGEWVRGFVPASCIDY